MKNSMFRLLTASLSILAIAIFAGTVFAQGDYRLELVDWPPVSGYDVGLSLEDVATVDVDGFGSSLFVVGYSWPLQSNWNTSAWIYDHQNALGYGNFIDVPTLLEIDNTNQTYTHCRCRAISNTGIVVGHLSRPNLPSLGFWFDLLAPDPKQTFTFLKDVFPVIDDGGNTTTRDVNIYGDILTSNEWVVNIFNNFEPKRLPAEFWAGSGGSTAINDIGYVVGSGDADSDGESDALRFNYLDEQAVVDVIGPSFSAIDINNSREFCGKVRVTFRRNRERDHIYRWRDGPDFDWLSPPDIAGFAYQINDAGDVTGQSQYEFDGYNGFFHYSERDASGVEIGTTHLIKDLVNDTYLQNADLYEVHVTERDNSLATPAPMIVGGAIGDTHKMFILIPDQLPPSPGISVSPSSGLVTSEAGGTDSFDVVLVAEPSADVSIGISSNDPTEGTAAPASLTFTPANWNTPQTVTVTGVDDADLDGDMAYTIITAAATSTDPEYDGLNPDDVSVTNLDDDAPSGGSDTYNSADTPVAIPDNDPSGVASNILAGDHLITNLTVNVNISHPRPSDLEVYLIDPAGGPPVQLFNFSGDNNVPDFNGTSSAGLWTLAVYDTRKKKTGTLDGWSITVDY